MISFLVATSKNVNSIYITHWCIIGFIDSVICGMFGIVFPFWQCYLLWLIVTISSHTMAFIWTKIKPNPIFLKNK